MKFAIVILAVIAAAQAQFGRPEVYSPFGNQYKPYNNQYNNNRYNPFSAFNTNQGQYNRFNQYSTPSPFRPFSTAAPTVTVAPVTSTIAPYTAAPFTATTPSPLPRPTPISIALAKQATSDARYASIVRYDNDAYPDGSYSYAYETNNGIAAQEQGTPRNFGGNPPLAPIVAQGSFSWISPEGVPIAISYIADENGYQPSGDAIPTSPPIPDYILRSLEYNARNSPVKK